MLLASLLGSHFRYLGLDHEGKPNSGKCYLGTVPGIYKRYCTLWRVPTKAEVDYGRLMPALKLQFRLSPTTLLI